MARTDEQFNLFGEGEDRLQAPARPMVDHAVQARARLAAVLELMRTSRTMPWSDRDARMWQTVFPQMSNWLPDAEAEQLRLEFAREIERLKAA